MNKSIALLIACICVISSTYAAECNPACGNTFWCDTAQDPGVCNACAADCKTCTGSEATACTECNSGFWQAAETKVCTACAAGCMTCTSADASTCTACMDGFFQNAETKVCSACAAGCKSCTSGEAAGCTTCMDGYWQDAETKVCATCMDKCLSCTTASDCTTCNEGYVFESGSCMLDCKPGQFNNGTGCQDCLAGCATCTGELSCRTCKAESMKCSYGQYLNEDLCEDCATVGCQLCEGNVCTACFEGYTFNAADGSCAKNTDYTCTDGQYYNLANATCIDCQDGAMHCTATNALKCMANHTWMQEALRCRNICVPDCVTGQNGCTKCGEETNYCEACDNQHVFNGFSRTCTRLSAAESCAAEGTYNFFFDGVRCMACDMGCGTCDYNAQNCTTCPEGTTRTMQDEQNATSIFTCVSPGSDGFKLFDHPILLIFIGLFLIAIVVAAYFMCRSGDDQDGHEYQMSDTDHQGKNTMMH